jgi:predicted nuclease of restriction endonuclease-like (RecB) superfamily
VQQPVALITQIPWGHNIAIISKCENTGEALYYAQSAAKYNWSRTVLVHQIESGLYNREGQSPNNFAVALPKPQSDLAKQTLKDPYIFDFLTITREHDERELENALVEHITKFLLELGAGFAYVGRQVPLRVGESDFYIDLLFYHLKLRSYVVIELKTTAFEPEFAGKLNFYLTAVDRQVRSEPYGSMRSGISAAGLVKTWTFWMMSWIFPLPRPNASRLPGILVWTLWPMMKRVTG